VLIGDGGSIPVVEAFKRYLKLDSLLLGFALESDSVHSPNENYNVESFRRGIRTWARVIAETQGDSKS
jgi:acetylornithine deacetylase/succinyl-diaminopimelate desuccinylase-like protein